MNTGMEIAIIGMSCRFPGADNLEEFWENIKQGKETISFLTPLELRANGVTEEELNNPNYVNACGVLEGSEYFDASFFGYTPKEAEIMDPQIRIFHECVWNALEDSGYESESYDGLIGLYAGAAQNLYWQARVLLPGKNNDIGDFASYQLINKDFLTLRISYKLDLKGPSLELSTACSTSLVAVHIACQALLNGECDIALAGGIRISNLEKRGYLYQEGMILSPDGHCRVFDAKAKGTIGTDGVGVVVLKSLEDAVRDRDHIYAIIKGTAINNDGVRKAGFSASSVEGQADVIATALQVAEVELESIGYIETHGTGTELGDPVEIEALKTAFETDKKGYCALGSVKSNIGHTDSAAGVAGLIKTVLALRYRLIPPTVHFDTPNPHLDFINTPFYVEVGLSSWEKGRYPRRAGVSSFGIGGTNAHVIVEEWQAEIERSTEQEENRLIVLSARTEPALDRMKINLAGFLQHHQDLDIAYVAYTLQVGRRAFNYRWMTICIDKTELLRGLTIPGNGETNMCSIEDESSESIDIEPGFSKDLLERVGRLWLQGQKINWQTLYPIEKPYRLPLPHYPFEKQKYWIQMEFPFVLQSKLETSELAKEMIGQTVGRHLRPTLSSPFISPRNRDEQILADIWRNVLGFDKIGVSDDFLELGGDSLRAITVIARMHQELGVNIPVTEFFARPTIEHIVEYIGTNKDSTLNSTLSPCEKKDYYTLSSSQQRIYFLHRMDPENKSYNISFIFTLSGKLDISRVEYSFKKIIQKHESLRTAFIMLPQGPVQVIHEDVHFALENFLSDETDIPEIFRNFIRPFDLENPPLLRIGLIKIHDSKYLLMLDIFHIIADGLSFETLIADFVSLYKGNDLPWMKLQYKDFAEWQNLQKSKGVLNQQKIYWEKQFGDEIPVLDLPGDYPRPLEQSFAGDNIIFALEKKEAEELKSLAIEEGTTLYIVVLTLYYLFLAKVSNQEDITVGTPTAGRRYVDLENIIGMFVNTLALRNYPASGKKVIDFLHEVKENVLNAFENQDYPYEELVEQTAVNRDLSRNPLFDTMFTLQKIEVKEIVIPGLNMAPFRLDNDTAKFDLLLTAMEYKDKLEFKIEYCTAIFEKITIERFILFFKQIVSQVLNNNSKKQVIREIEIIPIGEKKNILYQFNNTSIGFPKDSILYRLFEEQDEKTPDHIAISGPSLHISSKDWELCQGMKDPPLPLVQLSYRELNRKSSLLANQLINKYIGPDIIVGIKLERSIEMITVIFGTLKSGGVYLPIDPKYPENRINYILKDSSAKLLITSNTWIDTGNNFNERNVNVQLLVADCQQEFIEGKSDGFSEKSIIGNRQSQTNSANLAYIIYTSGSTGKPKGVGIENSSVINRLFWMQRMYPLESHDIILQKTPITFDVSVWELFWWSFCGAGLCLLGPGKEKDPSAIVTAIEKYGISVIHFVPSMLKAFLEYVKEKPDLRKLSCLKHVFASGEPLGLHDVETFNRLFNDHSGTALINLYGPTEATVDVTYFNCISPINIPSIPIGKPIDNIQILIFNKQMKMQPIGIIGELCIAGVGLARGYINRPDLTAETFLINSNMQDLSDDCHFPKRIYRTGDLARWLPEGDIEFFGRIDFQVKIRGFRIELGEIENHLLKYNQIKQALVLAKADEKKENSIYAYIISDTQLEVTDLRKYLSGCIPEYMIPSHFIQVEKIPLTPSGKVDRKELALYGKRLNMGTIFQSPHNDTQEKIVGIWKQVLKQDQISIHDNYFDLGGTSLDILKINKHLKETFQIEIPIAVMFRYTTVYLLENFLHRQFGEVKSAGDYPKIIKLPEVERVKRIQKVRGIAIIGMAARFPGATNLSEFWENLKLGIESVSFFSANELRDSGVSIEEIDNRNYVNATGVLAGIEFFDASFFGYTPKEAEIMDPQIRIFHECVWNAFEDAGYVPGEYEGLIGFYGGSSPNTSWQARVYLQGKQNDIGDFSTHQLINKGYLTSRISYKLNLKGPSFELNTACSTALVAIHTACRAIGLGECDMAVAGGVSISHLEKSGYLYQEGMIFSPDGHCRSFDAAAKGTIGSDGAGVVVLKSIDDSIRDRDHIYAIIKGTAINNDGIRKAGFSASSVEGQAAVIREALDVAGVEPESINYIEAHGTGTELGDPVEIEALNLAYNIEKKSFCAVGSVKSNIGHTDAAAGAASMIKTILALKYQLIPPTIHFEIPNPYIDIINSPFYINTNLCKWEKGKNPRRAGVSSFGLGGTNAHAILEEWLPDREQITENIRNRLFVLSAGTENALNERKKCLLEYLRLHPDVNPLDLSYTLLMGRKALKRRWIAVCTNVDELIESLISPDTSGCSLCQKDELNPASMKIESGASKEHLIEIGNLWLNSQEFDWGSLYLEEKPSRISLPGYPFEKHKYWLKSEKHFSESQIKKNANSIPEMAEWFYFPTWKSSLPPSNANKEKFLQQRCLVFVTDLNVCTLLVNHLKEIYRDVIVVKKGNTFIHENDNLFTFNTHDYSQYEYIMDTLGNTGGLPEKIIHMWSITSGDEGISGYRDELMAFEKDQENGFFSLMYLAQALGKQGFKHEIHLHVLTNSLQEVTGNEIVIPGKSTILGLLKVIPQEYAGVRCNSIDIELPLPGSREEENIVDSLVDELIIDSTGMEVEIAYRNNRRWTLTFDQLHLDSPKIEKLNMKIRSNGVFLITGGLGEIGLMFAELFIKKVKARLILTGRSPFPSDDTGAKINQLKEMGGDIIYMQADIADLEQMKNVIREAEKHFGPVNGIVHTAGLTEGQSIKIIRDLNPTDCRVQFQAKVYGVLALEELFKDKLLDFCWLLSSISCVLGGLGFGAYAAANRFMDGWVKKHNRLNSQNSRWFSLNWDGMEASQSIEMFERLFTQNRADILAVSRQGNLPERIDRWIKLSNLIEKNGADAENQANTFLTANSRPDLSNEYSPPRNSLEEVLVSIWQNLLGFDRIGITDDFLELGGDSLQAITVISRIHRESGINIPVTEFFAHPTIESISSYICANKKNTIYKTIEPVEKKEYYLLSSAQLRIYILYRMDMESKGYNIPFVFQLEGDVDSHKLEYAFKKLIQQYESLRTAFIMSPQGPAQIIRDDVRFAVEHFNGIESEIPLIYETFARPFDLEVPPLLRIGLIKLGQRKYIMMLDIFHIITDGISFDILIKEFTSLYSGKEMPVIKLQYKDFVEWQNRRKSRGMLDREEAYWKEQFACEIPILDINPDYSRPPVQRFVGDRLNFVLEEDKVKALKTLALQEGITLYVVLLTIYYIFLAKLSNQEDIVVGTPTAGRRHSDLEKIIGMFVNILALRNYPCAAKSVLDFLREVKESTLNAFENQDFQYEELVEQVAVNRDLSRNPLFDTMFTLQNIDFKEIEIPGLKLSPFHFDNKTSKFDLSLTGMENQEKLIFIFEFSTELFKKETIERFIDFFKRIVEDVLAIEIKKIKIREIEIIPSEEKWKILYEFNDTFKKYPENKTIWRLFSEQVERTPGQISVAQSLNQITYSALFKESTLFSNALSEEGVGVDTIVGLIMNRSVEMMISLLGILNSGSAYLPIDPEYPSERIEFMLADSGAKLLVKSDPVPTKMGDINNKYVENQLSIVESQWKDHVKNNQIRSNSTGNLNESELFPTITGKVIRKINLPQLSKCFQDTFRSKQHSLFPVTSLAYVIYTSGSTGRPKGVMIMNSSVRNFIEGIAERISFTAGKAILALTTISFDIFGLETLLPLCRGLKVVVANENQQRDMYLLEDVIIRNCVDMLQATPTRMQMFTNNRTERSCLVNLKEIMVGGERFPTALLEDLKKLTSAKIYNMYGPTETTIWSTVSDLTKTEEITIGNPILNTQIYICDRNNCVQPLGVSGELYIGGRGLARGYLNHPQLTADKFITVSKVIRKSASPNKKYKNEDSFNVEVAESNVIYSTGDLARWRFDGKIEFLGRSDYQVKIRGFRIELREIEQCLLKYEYIKEAAVIERIDETNDRYLAAYLITEKPVDTTELRNLLSKSLPEYMVPQFFIRLEKLPLTLNGKIDRNALPAIQLKKESIFLAPEDEVEEKLVRIWSQVLGMEEANISTGANFFQLGGQSLKATFMLIEIQKEFDIIVPIGEIFLVPTIKNIANLIKVVLWAKESDDVNLVKTQNHKEIIL